jgi:ferrous iron transport protein B
MKPQLKVALIGNPTVGKSTLFSRLTGIGVIISNYPGTTVEVAHGRVRHDEVSLDLSDLPGVYSLDTDTPEERTLIEYLHAEKPDVVLNVVDATRLERNLYLTLEVLELGMPVVVALNMSDEARGLGMDIDADKLSHILGVPVIPTSAQKGSGLEELMHAFRNPPDGEKRMTRYDRHIESMVKDLMGMDKSLSRHDAIILLSNAGDLSIYGEGVRTAAAEMRKEVERTHEEPITEILASNRYGDAGLIAKSVMHHKHTSEMTLKERIDNLLVHPAWGFAILAIIMLSMLLIVFLIGGFLGGIIDSAFERFILNPVTAAFETQPFVQVVVRYTLIGVQAGLGIVVPYIMTFYVFMAILENTGYLTRAAFLLDEIMHRFRLHGRALVPLVLGFGCSVPAIMSTRMLQTKRERIVTCVMICMVPCSARSIIIMGLVARFVSVWAALSIYLLMLALMVAIGFILGRTVKGEETGFVLEMVPLRVPNATDVVSKTWAQMKDFVYVAFPLLIVGSAVLGVLQYAGILQIVNGLMSPITTTWMGLPDYTATALIFGILRKEMALETLAVMAGVSVTQFGAAFTGLQMYTFAVFTTIYMPCLATIAMLKRVLGWKDTILITVLTFSLALLISGLIAHLLPIVLSLL